jgi:hypothetical protein
LTTMRDVPLATVSGHGWLGRRANLPGAHPDFRAPVASLEFEAGQLCEQQSTYPEDGCKRACDGTACVASIASPLRL